MQVRPGAPGVVTGVIVQMVTRPVQFFRAMPKKGGFLGPWRFVVAISVIDAVLDALFLVTAGGHTLLPEAGALLVVVPVLLTLTSFFFSGILFALWWLMGSSQSFETAYRVFAYTSAITPITTLLGFVPYLGVIGLGWWFGLLGLAGVYVHGISPRKSFAVFAVLAMAAAASMMQFERQILKMDAAHLPAAARDHFVTHSAAHSLPT
ncbi:MAG: YIP1 family protein [Gammaproteobacteria bacterium]|nr:YIP1 family protein [Gammaproteobacteria bacterium]